MIDGALPTADTTAPVNAAVPAEAIDDATGAPTDGPVADEGVEPAGDDTATPAGAASPAPIAVEPDNADTVTTS